MRDRELGSLDQRPDSGKKRRRKMMQRQERQRDPDGDFGRDGLEYARPALTRARARDGLRNEGGHGNGGCWNHRGICWSMDVRCRDSCHFWNFLFKIVFLLCDLMM
uniref:Uncharacterized protein n=1 Tax=Coccidioides posadasii RMSCC 3488 TaxID=454284 RepID=A0A0J6FD57_COCPO|nr:hypothetical protein CPAG_07353 [Coccidioides posadasii RMSCC 3488]